jgi:hypothetical protein
MRTFCKTSKSLPDCAAIGHLYWDLGCRYSGAALAPHAAIAARSIRT